MLPEPWDVRQNVLYAGRQDKLASLERAAVRKVSGEGVVLSCDLDNLTIENGEVIEGKLMSSSLEEMDGIAPVITEQAVGRGGGSAATGTCGTQHTATPAACTVQGGAEAREASADDQHFIGDSEVVGHALDQLNTRSSHQNSI
ncbi:hypothetical protein ASF71_20845 [Deinococcus sp. Leaf326]|nr:hypothetical protein ASF71_20845 [Deinococcus sp. Leaf326]